MISRNKDVSGDNLKSQIVTSSWGENRKLPYAFTEQGIYMLATVLRGELAEQQSIFIMRTFREMRHYIKQNQQFVTQAEMNLVTAKVSDISVQVAGITDWKKKTEKDIENIQKSIDTLNENFVSNKDFKDFTAFITEEGRRRSYFIYREWAWSKRIFDHSSGK